MKEILKEYIKIFAYVSTGIVFMFASFYLIINIYHMQEVSKTFSIDIEEDQNYQDIVNKLDNIEKYTNVNVDNSKSKANKEFLKTLQNKLNYCKSSINNDELKELAKKNSLSIKDVYNLRNALNTKVINGCLIEQLNYLTYYDDKDGNSNGLTKYSDYIKLNIDTISNKLEYIDKDLLNNSSYHYNSDTADLTVMDKQKAMFDELMKTYDESTSLVETISKWLYQEVGGSND